MTKSEIQPEDKAPMFAKGQKIWVEATIVDDKPSPNGKILIEIQSDNTFSKTSLIRAYPERIKTTKQICDEQNTRLTSQNEEALTLDEKMGALEKIIATETERLKDWEWDDEIREWKPKTANVGGETPQDAELTEPDRTRYFKKGDKVQRRKKLDGRDLRKTLPSLPFDEIFTIAEDEKNPWEIKVKWGDKTAQGGFIYFELVEPAPEEKFFIEDETSYDSYTINFGTPDDYQFVAKLDTDFYTLEEARQECERISKKDQDHE